MAKNESMNDSSSSSNNSSNNELHFFEGVEKLLEIWFLPNPSKNADLRKIPRPMWNALLKSVRCEIISFSRNDNIDAYVLSESSMFVSKHRWILKTCGTTTLLQCLEPLLELAYGIAGFTEIKDFFYSRKNFKRPELQISPHGSFSEEVSLLDSIFKDGRAYCFGSVNRDCWYLYTLDHDINEGTKLCHLINGLLGNNNMMNGLTVFNSFNNDDNVDNKECNIRNNGINNDGNHNKENDNNMILRTDHDGNILNGSGIDKNGLKHQCTIENINNKMKKSFEPDQTIEILMTELDPKIMSIFTKETCSNALEATVKSGINKLIPGMNIDDYLFEPCGYSMNGISKNGYYMTIHVTPEEEFSYVSFESNIATSNYNDLINRVIKTFQPGKFIVTIFANRTSTSSSKAFCDLDNANRLGDSWQRQDIQYCRFKTYDLTYAHYCKFPS
ncbi:S-adenosylmethionine decarboxylase proenzyme isoform X2 [Condylostylus longicornis]|uniref:S-adenosylmethionine decarboxylase proenzyme isoform X2 n=1 Tax=Condylostylus longicornis TaxID=2530218 RepID=UPI00244DA29A|nr:S-adenosylmethionine decarboxylase proenzyme isoform X2 [Condylostylus longicornis]